MFVPAEKNFTSKENSIDCEGSWQMNTVHITSEITRDSKNQKENSNSFSTAKTPLGTNCKLRWCLKETAVSQFYTLSSECLFLILFSTHFPKCLQGEFDQQSGASSVDNHFLKSCNLNVWFSDDVVRRN